MPQVSRSFAKRELEGVRDEVYLKDPRPLSGYDLFPQRRDITAYKKFYIIRQFEMIGFSTWFSEMGDDWPRADTIIDEDQFPLRRHGVAYGYSDDDLAAAEDNARDLRENRGMSARRAVRQRNNAAMFFGDTAAGIFGFVNYPGAVRVYFNNKINSNTGANTIYNEVTGFIDTIGEVNKDNVEADMVAMPTSEFNHMRKRRFGSGSDMTILEKLRDIYSDAEGNAEVEFEKAPELAGAGPDGEDVLIAFVEDEQGFAHLFPRPFEQEPPEIDFPHWIIKTHAKTGGMGADKPLYMCVGLLPN